MQSKVLVVDDDRFMRRVLTDLLEESGFVTVEAENGQQAIDIALEEDPDAIIMDLVMPVLDGARACQRLRQVNRFRNTPILMLTSRADLQGEVNPFQVGADDYLSKPFDTLDLLARVQGNLVKKRALDALEQQARDYQALLDISESIGSSLETPQILQSIVTRIARHIANVVRCSIAVIQEDSAEGFVLASSDDASLGELRLDLGKYPEISEVMQSGKALLIKDVDQDPLLDQVRPLLQGRGFNAILVLPIHSRKRVIGVMILRVDRKGGVPGDKEIEFCKLIADVAAGPLRNARFFRKLRSESENLRKAKRGLEDELQLKAVYERLFDNASEGLIAVNTQGDIVFANRCALEVAGYERDELKRLRLDDLLDLPGLKTAVDLWKRGPSDGDGGRVRMDVTMRRRDGGTRLLSVSARKQVVLGELVIIAFRDVTTKRKVETELQQTKETLEATNLKLQQMDQVRAEFLNTATHELRIPVTIVHGYCSLLVEMGTENLTDQQREFLEAAYESSEKLVDLVNNMLDLSRFQAGKMGLDIAPGDLRETVQQVCSELVTIADKEGLTLHYNDLPPKRADYDEHNIQRVLTNLLGNAIKFTPGGGEVRVSFGDAPDGVRVTVEDTGKGIPSQVLPDLFEEFAQVGMDDARRGTGLGLAICKKIVESHGGRIWAESTPGVGSRFSFTLPGTEN